MARFQKPSDPRESDLKSLRKRRQRQDGAEPFPWLWFGLGIGVTIVGILLALALVNALLAREPLATSLATPTIIRLTAPPSAEPSPTEDLLTPTPIPTLTPVPTRDLSSPPEEVTVGYYAQVSGTGEAGLTVRGGPSTDNVRVQRATEGTLMLVIDGPVEGGDYRWWEVRLLDGTEGWVAEDFLAPAAAPGSGQPAGEATAEPVEQDEGEQSDEDEADGQ